MEEENCGGYDQLRKCYEQSSDYKNQEEFLRSFPSIVFRFESIDGAPDALYLFEPRNYFTNVDFRKEKAQKEENPEGADARIGINLQIWTF